MTSSAVTTLSLASMVVGSVAAGAIALAPAASAAVPVKYIANSGVSASGHHRRHRFVKEAVPKVRIPNSSALSGLHHNA